MDYREKCHCINETHNWFHHGGGGENLPHPPLIREEGSQKQTINSKDKVEGSLISHTRTMSNVSNMRDKLDKGVRPRENYLILHTKPLPNAT